MTKNQIFSLVLLSSVLNQSGGLGLQKKKFIQDLPDPAKEQYIDLISLTPGGLHYVLYLLTSHSLFQIDYNDKVVHCYHSKNENFTSFTGLYHVGGPNQVFLRGPVLYLADT